MSSINTNLASLYAQKNMGKLATAMPTAVERLSSGLRINRAKDDAAGLGIAEKIQTQVKATTQSMKNANDAISMVQAAEGS
jgi:flagellin